MSPRTFHAEQRLLDLISRIRTWKQGSQRAPHKPLLLLLALGRVQRGEPRLVPFSEIEEKLQGLLASYGPARRSYHPEFPFWHLKTDRLWEVPGGERLKKREGSTRPLVTELRRAAGGFLEEIDELLRANPELLRQVAHALLDEHFPASYHKDLLTAVGLDLTSPHARRNPDFRDQVLNAYGYQCGVRSTIRGSILA